jgi:gamma-glutamyltranspeptidase / glutathione hydrolase
MGLFRTISGHCRRELNCYLPRVAPFLALVLAAAPAQASPYAQVLPDQRGAIATVQPLATQAAAEAFARGGNAVDAALAAAFTLGVVDSHNSGIGGGCFILARLADGRILAIDGREKAPGAAHPRLYYRLGKVEPRLSQTGPLAVGVPGSVQALWELQQQGGALRFADVLLPAADLAERGFALDATLALRLAATAKDLWQYPANRSLFFNTAGEPKKAGDLLQQPDLARSYRALAAQGPEWFYRGDFARALAGWMAAEGGIITRADLAAYTTVKRAPIRSNFYGYEIVGFPPPSSGGVHVAQILNQIDRDPLATMPALERAHLLAEAMKRAFADRAYWLGDSDFVPVPIGLLDTRYAKQLRAQIGPVATPAVQAGKPPGADHFESSHNLDPGHKLDPSHNRHTTHIAVADQAGNWVAITSTLNTPFGSKVMVPGTGILLNNQMDDFATAPGEPNAFGLIGAEANAIAPGKRPLSSMSPTLVLRHGQPVMTLGAAGGPTIISQVVQVLINRLALSMPLDQALAAPRLHHQWLPDRLFVEWPADDPLYQGLLAKGHSLAPAGDFGGTQAIAHEAGQFVAVTEPRVIRRNQAAAR